MNKTIIKLIRRFKTNDPFVISEGLNIYIRYADLGKVTRGIYYRKLRRRFIVIHDQLDEYWKRFVCAHELGHDRLHRGINHFWLDKNSLFNPGKYERQANTFAVRLLVANDKPNRGDTIGKVLKRNGVPEEMKRFYF